MTVQSLYEKLQMEKNNNHKNCKHMNRKFNGKVVITRKSIKGENSQVARIARFDMEKDGITPLEEKQVFTPEELDELYAKDDSDEPWWNKY